LNSITWILRGQLRRIFGSTKLRWSIPSVAMTTQRQTTTIDSFAINLEDRLKLARTSR
jgi:hypothetical protein